MTTALSNAATTLAVATKTTTYTATGNDGLLIGDTSGGGFTITLPSAASNPGKVLRFKNIGTNTLTLARAGSDTIDGATSRTLTVQYEAIELVSDGASAWHVF